jgi:hypothetical protein
VLLASLGWAPSAEAASGWFLVSAASEGRDDAPAAIHDASGTFHVAWGQGVPTHPQPYSIRYRTRTARGAWTQPITVTSGWDSLRGPGLFMMGDRVHAVFAGNGPYGTARYAGVAWHAQLQNGRWATTPAPLTQFGNAGSNRSGYGWLSAAVDSAGTPWTVWEAPEFAGQVLLHGGLDASGPEYMLSQSTWGNPNIVSDARGDVYVVFSMSNPSASGGVWALMVGPERGRIVRLPGARSTSVLVGSNRLPVAARSTGGAYAAYCDSGWSCTRIRVGGSDGHSLAIRATDPVAQCIGTGGGPDGRMWVWWGDRTNLYATRSNKALTRWGPVQRFRLPLPDQCFLGSGSGDAVRGSLDVVVRARPDGVVSHPLYARHIKPKLSLATHVVPARAGYRVDARLLDAGDAVTGTVRFGRRTLTVRAGEVAYFYVSAHRYPRTYSFAGAARGYVGTTTAVTIG